MSEVRKLISQIYKEVFINDDEQTASELIVELLNKTNYDLDKILELAGKTLGMERYVWFYTYLMNWIIHYLGSVVAN
ncbi:MAG: hypothetical protein DRJ03_26135 [Chloroflexi bacterium]|nr:MAG: hypothetical protein DRJ03_26135 [Chloroflexota bacterium]